MRRTSELVVERQLERVRLSERHRRRIDPVGRRDCGGRRDVVDVGALLRDVGEIPCPWDRHFLDRVTGKVEQPAKRLRTSIGQREGRRAGASEVGEFVVDRDGAAGIGVDLPADQGEPVDLAVAGTADPCDAAAIDDAEHLAVTVEKASVVVRSDAAVPRDVELAADHIDRVDRSRQFKVEDLRTAIRRRLLLDGDRAGEYHRCARERTVLAADAFAGGRVVVVEADQPHVERRAADRGSRHAIAPVGAGRDVAAPSKHERPELGSAGVADPRQPRGRIVVADVLEGQRDRGRTAACISAGDGVRVEG